MNNRNDEEFRELLRSAVAPVADTELKTDLWPRMLRRMDETSIRVPWFDWALLALLPVWLFLFPEVILVLLYHL